MKNLKKYLPYIPFVFLVILIIFIWFFVLNRNKEQYLKVVFLDVGQGDAIYIESPNKKQILIDGGPDAKLLSELGKVMPFADRSIDMIIATHGDMDHIGGLSILSDNYNIDNILVSGNNSSSQISDSLDEKIKKYNIKKIIAKRGMHIVMDDKENIYLDILFPDRDVSNFDTNDSSIVAKLTHKNNSFMFTGDASLYTENLIEWNEKEDTLDSDVLKLGHHGAKTSSSILWLEKITPDIAIISAGKNNKYGHPSKDVIDRLNNLKIPYLNTANVGNIIFKSDGMKLIY